MGDKSAIEWTDATWNPVHGCSKVSAGCTNCYAEKVSHRFGFTSKPWNATYATENVQLHPERLDQPLRWKRPRRIFVNSMSDLFHEQVPDEFIAAIFGIMASSPDHTFQILTKRPERMASWFEWVERMSQRIESVFPDDDPNWRRRHILRAAAVRYLGTGDVHDIPDPAPWPLPNVWLGVSVENQEAADTRISLLLQTPAAVRFLSCEPLLGPVDLSSYLQWQNTDEWGSFTETQRMLDWVIAGGESGPNARPMHPDWARGLRDQCNAAEVAYFFKQWGEWLPNAQEYGANPGDFDYERKHVMVGDIPMCRAGKKQAGRTLDGRTWDEMPS